MEGISVGIWALLPALIAIGLALITKEVLSSLVIGILSGTLIYAFSTGGGVVSAVSNIFTIMSNEFSASMIIFLCLLGGLVAVTSMAGGSRAYGDWAAKKVKSGKTAQLATCGLGAVIFIDDYFNCLTVGTVMKPVTDKFNISREKLAYIIDSTAAPVCIIAPVSSWAASVISSLPETENGGMGTFLKTIPYNLYAILTIVMVIVLSVTKLDFGAMAKFQSKAEKNDNIESIESASTDELAHVKVSSKGKVIDLILPIVALIIFSILSMLYTGGYFNGEGLSLFEAFGATDANLSLAMGGFGAIIVAMLMFIPRKILTFKGFMDGIVIGFKSMVGACTILTLAWTLKGVCASLSLDVYVSTMVKESAFPIAFLPGVIFLVAAFLSFATGTAWGTFGILIPIVSGLFGADILLQNPEILIISLSATLAGSVFGDHCSPISDTTILSSTGANCDHVNHVSSQIPYACVVAGCSFIGYIVAGFTSNVYITLVASLALFAIVMFVVKITKKTNA